MDRRKFLTGTAAVMGGALLPTFGSVDPIFASPTRNPHRPRPSSSPLPPPGSGGQIPPGQRAAPGTVGFLGNENTLTVLSNGDPLGALAGDAEWQGGALRINTANFTLQNYKINTGVFAADGTTTFTVRNCVINDATGQAAGLHIAHASGKLLVYDTTVRVPSVDGERGTCLSALSNVIEAYRCDLSGFEDGIGAGGPSIIDQCYIHDLDGAGTDPHNDAIQHLPGVGGGSIQVTNCYINGNEAGSPSQYASGCLTFDTDSGCVVRNCYMNYGAYDFRIEGATNVHATDNNFGPNFAFGEVAASGVYSIAEWTNNRKSDGSLIPSP